MIQSGSGIFYESARDLAIGFMYSPVESLFWRSGNLEDECGSADGDDGAILNSQPVFLAQERGTYKSASAVSSSNLVKDRSVFFISSIRFT